MKIDWRMFGEPVCIGWFNVIFGTAGALTGGLFLILVASILMKEPLGLTFVFDPYFVKIFFLPVLALLLFAGSGVALLKKHPLPFLLALVLLGASISISLFLLLSAWSERFEVIAAIERSRAQGEPDWHYEYYLSLAFFTLVAVIEWVFLLLKIRVKFTRTGGG
jgi:hypothetical protein